MKQYAGVPNNINNEIVGKVRYFKWPFIYRRNIILIAEKEPRYNLSGNCVLVKENVKDPNRKIPTVSRIGVGIGELNEGDVVLIEKSGKINILYDSQNEDNVLILSRSCNAACIMCPQINGNNNQDAILDFNKKIMSLMPKSTKYLAFTGGEPTLFKDQLLSSILVAKKKLPNTVIAILTNGILLENIDYVKDIIDLQHPNLVFQIPIYSDIDTMHDKIVGVNGFASTIKAVYNLALFDQKIEIRIVIQKLNYKRLPNLAEFIYRNMPFVSHVAFMGLELEGMAKDNLPGIWINPIEDDYQNALMKAAIVLNRRDVNFSIYNHPLCLLKKELWSFAKKSISNWKRKYAEICNGCTQLNNCGGFFKSTINELERYIRIIQ